MRLYVALEVDFLVALALGEENTNAALDTIVRLRGTPLVTPSVLQELALQATSQKDEALRGPAKVALSLISSRHMLMPELTPKDHAIADLTARKLVARGLRSDYQSSLILAEAALSHCAVLLTYQTKNCSVDVAAMKLFFVECDINDCVAVPPHWFVNFFEKSPLAEAGSHI